jgi:hypothetical protein
MKAKFPYAEAFNIAPATPDIVARFIGHGLTMPVAPVVSTEHLAQRIRSRKYRMRLRSEGRNSAGKPYAKENHDH